LQRINYAIHINKNESIEENKLFKTHKKDDLLNGWFSPKIYTTAYIVCLVIITYLKNVMLRLLSCIEVRK